MKLKYPLLIILFLGINVSIKCQSPNENTPLENSKISKINSSDLYGRWHLVEITLKIDDSEGLGSEVEESFIKSRISQQKVKKQIQNGELAIITRFNYDGTYTHELVFSAPEVRFPHYNESGTWSFDESTKQLARKSIDQEITTLESTEVKYLDQNKLILELRYTPSYSLSVYLSSKINLF
ncbi:MAG: DUF5004 domain-containing protein [Bacteroidota bacterium]